MKNNILYNQLIKLPEWQRKRFEVLERDNWTCTKCNKGIDELYSLGYIFNVHHIKYIYNYKPWDYDNELLITLCSGCHKIEHGYDLNNEYLNVYWQKKRLELMNRDNFTCVECFDDKSILNIHHVKYATFLLGKIDVCSCDENELITLCDKCNNKKKKLNRISDILEREEIMKSMYGYEKEEFSNTLNFENFNQWNCGNYLYDKKYNQFNI